MENGLAFDIEADELELFIQDVNEYLDAIETGVLRLEQGPKSFVPEPKDQGLVKERGDDSGTLDATFRAAHTLKALAATVGHSRMAELTHALETLFDVMRDDGLRPTQAVTDVLLDTVDALKTLRDEVVTQEPSGVDVDACVAQLRALSSPPRGEEKPDFWEETRFLEVQSWLTSEQAAQVEDYGRQGYGVLKVEATARADAFASGARLLQAALALQEAGHVITQQPSQADLAEGRHSGHLWLILATRSDADAVEEILAGVSDLAQFRVHPYSHDLGSPDELPRVPTSQQVPTSPHESPGVPASETVRISTERLDALMNLVGELVTDRTRLAQIQDTLRVQYGKNGKNETVGALDDMITHFDRVVDQLQEEVMQARMLPIEHLFRKFPRLVRDLARSEGKQVNLVIEGEATELDRSVIEVIGDPLIHLLRNAVDHGVEAPQERIAAGKPPAGTIRLTAAHEEGHIVITVRDDGRGIDPERIRRSGVSRGLLTEEEATQLDDDAAVNLIFQPNLSTAKQVTDVSGRGVGLDVVRTNVRQLSGSVVVESERGRGTAFRVTLPLTLAIVQAMMVRLGDDVYAIPLASIIEALYLADVSPGSVKGKPVIHWRDQVLPLMPLRRVLVHPRLATAPPRDSRQAVVTVAWGKLKAGLIVDGLLGKQEIVIKSLGSFVGNVPGLSGCTILGDGRIALIVDVPGLINACLQSHRQEVTT